MTYLLRLLLIAVAIWALFRLLRHLLLGPPGGSKPPSRGEEAAPRREQGRLSETLVSCSACGLRIPEGEALRVEGPDGVRHACSEECRRQLEP